MQFERQKIPVTIVNCFQLQDKLFNQKPIRNQFDDSSALLFYIIYWAIFNSIRPLEQLAVDSWWNQWASYAEQSRHRILRIRAVGDSRSFFQPLMELQINTTCWICDSRAKRAAYGNCEVKINFQLAAMQRKFSTGDP